MENSDPKNTKPIPSNADQDSSSAEENQPQVIDFLDDLSDEKPSAKPKRSRLRLGMYALLAISMVIGLAVLAGYQSGSVLKNENLAINNAVEAVIQYQHALDDMAAGRCEFARQRLESAIEYDPEYPGIAKLLADAYVCISATGTPTPVPTATLTPTPDVRSVDELFSDAQNFLQAEEWGLLIDSLDSLRKNDPSHMAIQVDGMYYLALRNRGQDKILVQGELEGGIFDLSRAEQFGPLDVQGNSYRLWAGLYLSGLSYWEVDWSQVIFYFEQVVPLVPSMWDGSFFASERMATASVYYSNDLVALGDFYLRVRGWCASNDAFIKASLYSPLSAIVAPTAQYAAERCELNPEATPRAEP